MPSQFFIRKDRKEIIDNFTIPNDFYTIRELVYAYKTLKFYKFLFFFIVEVHNYLGKGINVNAFCLKTSVENRYKKEISDLRSELKSSKTELQKCNDIINRKKKKKKNNKNKRKKIKNNVVAHNIDVLNSINKAKSSVSKALSGNAKGIVKKSLMVVNRYLDNRFKGVSQSLSSKSVPNIFKSKKESPSKKRRRSQRAVKFNEVAFKLKSGKYFLKFNFFGELEVIKDTGSISVFGRPLYETVCYYKMDYKTSGFYYLLDMLYDGINYSLFPSNSKETVDNCFDVIRNIYKDNEKEIDELYSKVLLRPRPEIK